MSPYLLLFLLAGIALAFPVERQLAPIATTTNGTVIGVTNNNIDSFYGIPFASPPLGNLRLKPPQPVATAYSVLAAVQLPRSCPQFQATVNLSDPQSAAQAATFNAPSWQSFANAGEDCLNLNIQRPKGTQANANLPVVFWIFGGGFEVGSTTTYDGSPIILKSVALGFPMIYVAVNYRTNGFGFLAGSDLAKEGSTNLGLRDQRLGLEWIADNIAAFGGDPNRVTIWGESAGSISVFDQTVIKSGDNTYKGKPLFRGAIMNSGSVVPTETVTSVQAQAIYDTVVYNAGCALASDRLACLRELSYQSLLTAVSTVPGIESYRALDLAYLPRPDPGDDFYPRSPELSLLNGQFTKVPIIVGDMQDEGTLFADSQSNITTNDELIQYLATYFPTNPNAIEDVTGLVANYPDEPLLGQPDGSPFGMGSQFNVYPQYKRIAAILGDFVFTLARRAYLDIVVPQGIPAWSYIGDFFSDDTQYQSAIGTSHGSDVAFSFNTAAGQLSPGLTFMTAFISFITLLDPNGIQVTPALTQWPQYNSTTRDIVLVGSKNTSLSTDDFRSGAAQFLLDHATVLRA